MARPEARRARRTPIAPDPAAVVPGFRSAGVHCGIKAEKPDLALLLSDVPAAVAGVFTRSGVVGAPVELSRERVRRGRARGVVVNSGCSNVGLGERGLADARSMAAAAARAAGCEADEILVASTGVIGEPLPLARIRRGVRDAAVMLAPDGLAAASRAILTTDTVPKLALRRLRVGGRPVTLAGIAKGSGMIEPNMGTMLAFLLTDAAVSPPYLRRLLRETTRVSFNRVTVDGETSTSDMALLFANGVAGHRTLTGPGSPGASGFATALREIGIELARALARDGEGATKLVTVCVRGARRESDAERAARRIANSLLVKTALFGGDPNWGRILQTLGASGVALDLSRIEIRLGGVAVFRSGRAAGAAARRRAEARLAESEVRIDVALGAGPGEAEVWTCDLSYDYVRINAEYTS